MYVKQILEHKGRNVVTVTPNEPVSETARLFVQHKIGAVVVVDEDEAIAGIFTERDIVHALAADGPVALARPVGEIMTRKIHTCGLSDHINDLKERMTSMRFRHLPVVENGHLVGMVSIGDVVKHSLSECKVEVDSLREYVADTGYAA